MPDYYRIERLFVVAGVKCAGKSSWMADPAAGWGDTALPAPVKRLRDSRPTSVETRQMAALRGRPLADVCLHVDISAPLLEIGGVGLENLAERLTADIFHRLPALASIRGAQHCTVFTLFASRQELLRRWLRRVEGEGRDVLRREMVLLLSDVAGGARALRQLYGAWDDFVRTHDQV
ncbi:MAG: hypothetical protein ACU85V_18720, partial [Gammaproteobacteria bacterium]